MMVPEQDKCLHWPGSSNVHWMEFRWAPPASISQCAQARWALGHHQAVPVAEAAIISKVKYVTAIITAIIAGIISEGKGGGFGPDHSMGGRWYFASGHC